MLIVMQMCIPRDWRARVAAMTLTAGRTPRTTRLALSAAMIAAAAPHAWAHPAAAAREGLDAVYKSIGSIHFVCLLWFCTHAQSHAR